MAEACTKMSPRKGAGGGGPQDGRTGSGLLSTFQMSIAGAQVPAPQQIAVLGLHDYTVPPTSLQRRR